METYYDKNQKYFYESDEDFMAALRKDYKKIDIQRELQVVDLANGGKIQPYVKGLQIENELNKVLWLIYSESSPWVMNHDRTRSL